MKKTSFILSLSAAALMIPMATAQAQTQTQPAQQNNSLGNLLGAIFGTQQPVAEQTMESDWNQGRQPFAQRRDMVEYRISEGVNNGNISRNQADSIRRDYRDLVETEARYAADGTISNDERRDLRERYRAMMQRLGSNGGGYAGQGQSGTNNPGSFNNQAGYGGYESIARQQDEFNARVNQAVQQRQITATQGRRLRTDYQGLMQLETSYARNGIDAREQADLANRLGVLQDRLGTGFGADNNVARWQQFEPRIRAAEQNRAITARDASQLRTELSDLARLDAAYSTNGLNADQRAYLTRRFAEVDARISATRR